MYLFLIFFSTVAIVALIAFFASCGPTQVHDRLSKANSAEPSYIALKPRPQFPVPSMLDVCHADQRLLWSTQIPALRFVSAHEPRGAYYAPLRLVYIGLAHQYPELYDGQSFQNWVEFCVAVGVFHFEDDAIHITSAGRELLEFLMNSQARQNA